MLVLAGAFWSVASYVCNRHAVPQLQTGVGFSMHEAQHKDQQESLDTLPAADASLYATEVI